MGECLNRLVATSIALWMKTKSFHWHTTGPRFPMLHGLFDAQASEVYDAIDPLAERVRVLGFPTVRNLIEATKLSVVEADYLESLDENAMLKALLEDNQQVVADLRKGAELAEKSRDLATANMLQDLLGRAEKRVWFLQAILRD